MRVNSPEEGHYWMRYVRGGPKVAVRIWLEVTPDPDFPDNEMDRASVLRCEVAGKEIDADKIVDIWHRCAGHPIDKAEYDYLLAALDWDRRHANTDPGRAVDLRDKPALF